MTRVLLVDDQEMVRAGFKIILQSEPGVEVVGEAATGADAVRLARELSPDVICMDVQMPVMDGLEATRQLVADPSVTAGILMLTTFDRDDYLFAALSAGASGFLLKSARAEDLIDAVQVIARGDALLAPAVTRRVIASFSASHQALPVPNEGNVGPESQLSGSAGSRGGKTPSFGTGGAGGGVSEAAHAAVSELTEREAEVLALVARGLSNAEIAAELFVGEATVKTHVSKVLMKLGLRDRIRAVIFAYENGLF